MTRRGSSRKGAVRPRSARNSVTSRILPENAAASSCSRASDAKRCVYSFSVEPQPAAFVMMASKSFAGKRSEIGAREIASHIAHSGMRRERAAAGLSGGHDDFAAVRLQDANRGAIEFAESDLRDASGEERHARAARALRRKRLPEIVEEKVRVDLRKQALAVAQAEQTQNARARASAASPDR